MTIEEIYYVSQIAAAVAIFGSLVFVGLQMRAQTREARYSTMNQILTDFHQAQVAMTHDPPAAQDFFTGHSYGLAGVAPERRAAAIVGRLSMLHLYERAYIQRTAGRLGDDAWVSIQRQTAPIIAGRATQEIWSLRKTSFAPGFVAYLDAEMASAPTVSYTQWNLATPQLSPSETEGSHP